MSPLLFAIFIMELGYILNTTGYGISMKFLIIVAILFADDLVILLKNKKDLNTVIGLVRKFFLVHRLEMSQSKSKIMSNEYEVGETVEFQGTEAMAQIKLEAVCSFRYLGIPINCSTRQFLKNFNELVKSKAKRYIASVFSMSRSGPDRGSLAYTLWTRVALPSILYGTEIMPLDKVTLRSLEKFSSSCK